MTYGTVNAETLTTSSPGGVLGAGNASIMKNRIINGAMVIDQRNAGASVTITTDTQYTLDRWAGRTSAAASKFSVQQNAGSVTPPDGFKNYLGVTSLSAYSVGASDYYTIQQNIEGYNIADLGFGTANAKTVTLSFWVRSSLTGTFGGSLINQAFSRCYPFSYTISSANTWTQISVTIAGETTGTWLSTNGVGMQVVFSLGMGSTYSGTAGAWTSSTILAPTGATSVVGTNGATFYITGVQLEVGSSATGYEYRNYQQELDLCLRYYWMLNNATAGLQSGSSFCLGYTFAANDSMSAFFNCPVPMRTTPTNLSISAASTWSAVIQGGVATSTTASAGGSTPYTVSIVLLGGGVAGGINSGCGRIRATGTGAYVDFSAEL